MKKREPDTIPLELKRIHITTTPRTKKYHFDKKLKPTSLVVSREKRWLWFKDGLYGDRFSVSINTARDLIELLHAALDDLGEES